MAVLVLAEHDNVSIRKATLNTVAAAQEIGGEIHVLVAGHNAGAAAKQAAQIAGVAKVLHADAAHLGEFLAENMAALVVALAKGYSHLLAPATSTGKDVMPRVAALLDVQQVSDIVAVESADTFVRPIYAGSALATVKSADRIKVITVRITGLGSSAFTSTAAIRYDNKYTGFVTATTTHGTAEFQFRAAGPVGDHTIELYGASHATPYLNIEQSPVAAVGTYRATFRVTSVRS